VLHWDVNPQGELEMLRGASRSWRFVAPTALVGGAVCFCEESKQRAVGEFKDRAQVQSLVNELQQHFVEKLEAIRLPTGSSVGEFKPSSWLRDGGLHGGGMRMGVSGTPIFNRASINVSAVHYDDKPKYPVKSATALSVILHPNNPLAPSMHFHISWMEPAKGKPYWRMIADLNPAIPDATAVATFEKSLKSVVPADLYEDSKIFGDKYFYIPALDRHRGASHMFVAKVDETDMPQVKRV
jgi:coproporphyrinogen III oxidase